MIDLSKYRVIDLTLTLGEDIRGFGSEIANTVEENGWNARNLHIYSHAGTHIDAPFHFGVSDDTIDDFSPEDTMGPAWVARINISEEQQLIRLQDLGDIKDEMEVGDSLILQTGWSHFVKEQKYRDGLPRISAELAHWCVAKKVKILGVEPPSVADVNNLPEVTEIHHILLKGKVVIVEGLTNLEAIKGDQVFLIAMPLKIYEGDGAPGRVIALESK